MSARVPVEIKVNIEGGDLTELFLVFSIDNGQSWYEVDMKQDGAFYSVTVPNISVGTYILYALKAIGLNGDEFLEDNNGQYFIQMAEPISNALVATPSSEVQTQPRPSNANTPLSTPTVPSSEVPPASSPDGQGQMSWSNVPAQKPEGQQTPQSEPLSPANKSPFPSPNAPQQTESSIASAQGDASTKVVSYPSPNGNSNTSPMPSHSNQGEVSTPTGSNQPVPQKTPSASGSVRPIIPYNPFPPDLGDIDKPLNALQSFSKIIGAKLTTQPSKKRSFIKRPQMQDTKQCSACKAHLAKKWKICAICGEKV